MNNVNYKKVNFSQSLKGLGVMLAEKSSVAVIFGGKKACTDGQTIFIPAVDLKSQVEWEKVEAFLHHETGHILFSDMSCFHRAGMISRAHQQIFNALEDPFVERKMSTLYPGMPAKMKTAIERLVADNVEEDSESSTGILLDAVLYLALRGYMVLYPGINLGEKISNLRTVLAETFGELTMCNLDDLIHRHVKTANSSQDTYLAMEQVFSLLKNGFEDKQDENSKSDQDSSASSSGSDTQDASDQDSSASSSGSDTQDASDQDSSASSSDSSSQDDSDQDSSASSSGSDTQDASDQDASASSAHLGSNSAKGFSPTGGPQFWEEITNVDGLDTAGTFGEELAKEICQMDTIPDSSAMQLPGIMPADKNPAFPLNNGEIDKATALFSPLRQAVLANSLKKVKRGEFGNRLDPKRLVGAVTGIDNRAFYAKAPKKAHDTYINLLLDCSESMEDRYMTQANYITNGLKNALECLPGIRLEAAGFTSVYPHQSPNPQQAAWIFPLTERNTGLPAIGGTPILEAMNWSAVRCMSAREARKVIFVITDGEFPDEYKKVMLQQVREMQAVGITIVGIFIGTASAFLPLSLHVKNVDDLSGAIRKIWQGLLYPDTYAA